MCYFLYEYFILLVHLCYCIYTIIVYLIDCQLPVFNFHMKKQQLLHEQVLSLMQGMKLVMKCGVVLCCIATNFAYVSCSICFQT